MDAAIDSIAFDYYHADWNDYMRRSMGGCLILKIQVGMDVYIPEIEITVCRRVSPAKFYFSFAPNNLCFDGGVGIFLSYTTLQDFARDTLKALEKWE